MLNGKSYYGNDGTISVKYLITNDKVTIHGQKITVKGIFIDNDTHAVTIKGRTPPEEGYKEVETIVGITLRLKTGKGGNFEPSDSVTDCFNSYRYALGVIQEDINRKAFQYLVDLEETLLYVGQSIDDDGGQFENKIYSFTYDDGLYTFLTTYAGYSGGTISYDRYLEMGD